MSKLDTGLQGDTEMEGPTKPKRVCPLKSKKYAFSEILLLLIAVKTCPHLLVKWINTLVCLQYVDFKTGDPFLWWSQHYQKFSILLKLAQLFLSTLATSVLSDIFAQLQETYTMKNKTGLSQNY